MVTVVIRPRLILLLLGVTAACKEPAPAAPAAPKAPPKPQVELVPRRCEPASAITNLDVFPAAGDRPATPTAVLATLRSLYVVGYSFDGRAGMAWVVRRASSHAPSRWSTVDHFEDGEAFATAVAETRRGIIVLGNVHRRSGSTWVARESAQGEAKTWRTVDAYDANPQGTTGLTVPHDVAMSADGAVVAVGEVDFGQGEPTAWLARQRGSDDKWSNVDIFRSPGAKSTSAAAVAVAGAQVYAAGSARSLKGALHWLVRMSGDGGATWATVDRLAGAVATDVAVARDGAVYVVGYRKAAKDRHAWLIRRSTDKGATWRTLASKATTGGPLTAAHAVAVDRSGVAYVGGSVELRGGARWTLKKLGNDSDTFETIDDYHHDTSKDAADKIDDLAIDARGHVVAIGDVYAKSRAWVVRGHPCVGQ